MHSPALSPTVNKVLCGERSFTAMTMVLKCAWLHISTSPKPKFNQAANAAVAVKYSGSAFSSGLLLFDTSPGSAIKFPLY